MAMASSVESIDSTNSLMLVLTTDMKPCWSRRTM
uniref:Uncharacterized protein n=1 Tax=Human herpesvirus 2 TaxID=10310 RepID=A0A481TXZ1_HHV2|nr:hypothetical protein [Human alphaherpesvirus 2]